MTSRKSGKEGNLFTSVIIILFITSIAGSLMAVCSQQTHAIKRQRNYIKAKAFAEAGIASAFDTIRQDPDNPNAAETTTDFADGQYTVTITKGSNDRVLINSVGTYGNADAEVALAIRLPNAGGVSTAVTDPDTSPWGYTIFVGDQFKGDCYGRSIDDSSDKDSGSKDKDSKDKDSGSKDKDSKDKDSKDKDSKDKDSKDKDSGSKDKDSKDKDSKDKDSKDKDSKDKDSKDKDSGSKDKDSKDKDSGSKDKDSKDKDSGSSDKDSSAVKLECAGGDVYSGRVYVGKDLTLHGEVNWQAETRIRKTASFGSDAANTQKSTASKWKGGYAGFGSPRVTASVPLINFPTLDLMEYYNTAVNNGQVFSGGKIAEDYDGNIPGGVMWYNGDVVFENNMTFTGCIIATGKITFEGITKHTQLNDLPAVISRDKSITFNGSYTGNGLIYAAKDITFNTSPQNDGMIFAGDDLTINGFFKFWGSDRIPDNAVVEEGKTTGGTTTLEVTAWQK